MLLSCVTLKLTSSHDPAPRNTFQPVFDKAYRARSSKGQVDEPVYLQQLALIFAVLAVGSHHNLEIPANDTGAEEFVSMSKMCLTADDFLNHNTMAGIQTVVCLQRYIFPDVSSFLDTIV